MKQISIARANTNIALIKYWGKRNEQEFLPMNSSLSLTLDAFYTDTKVTLDDQLKKDSFFLNGKKQNDKETNKITHFVNLFRKEANISIPIKVESVNHVPTAAGLASSASAYAALGTALNKATGLNLDKQTLSTFVRRGSGSATRSIYGGFVEWQKGTCSKDSYAVPIDPANWDIAMIIVTVNSGKKEISSREGMKRTVETSPFYPAWVDAATADLIEIKKAIEQHNFIRLGEITESNCMKMHGSMLGAIPPISYWEADSVKVMNKVKQLRQQGWMCYVTMDAGPNVKILCKQSESEKIKSLLSEEIPAEKIVISNVGVGARLLTKENLS